MERDKGVRDYSGHGMALLPFILDDTALTAGFYLACPYDGGRMCKEEGTGIPGAV